MECKMLMSYEENLNWIALNQMWDDEDSILIENSILIETI